MNKLTTFAAVSGLLVGMAAAGTAMAVAIPVAVPCGTDTAKNYMISTGVDACLDSGTGNLSGTPKGANPDPFLTGVGTEYELASKSDATNPFNVTFTDSSWSFDDSFWDNYEFGALGFKYGTGNTPDEWMVYSLTSFSTDGDYEFFGVLAPGEGEDGRLSHVNLYGSGPVPVPEPMTLGLLGIGLLVMGMIATRRRQMQ